AELNLLEQAGQPLARIGEYHGQFNFIARLRQPVAVVAPAQALDWTQAHPSGVLIQVTDKPPIDAPPPLFRQAYRGTTLALWPAAAIIAQPRLAAPD